MGIGEQVTFDSQNDLHSLLVANPSLQEEIKTLTDTLSKALSELGTKMYEQANAANQNAEPKGEETEDATKKAEEDNK